MPKKAAWPPKPYPHAHGKDRVRWKGDDYYIPRGDEAAYKALIVRLAAEDLAPKPSGPDPLSVAGAVLAWSAEVLPTLAEKAQVRYARALTVLTRVAGDMPVASFESGDLDRVRSAMRSGSWLLPEEVGRHGLSAAPPAGPKKKAAKKPGHQGGAAKGGGPWCASHVNRQVGRIKTVWAWLELRKHVPKGSTAELRLLKRLPVKKKKRRDWRTADVVKVAAAMTRSPARHMLLVQMWTGARSAEIRCMRWSEIDTSPEVWVWSPADHKNAWRGQERVIPIGPRAKAVLLAQRRREPGSDIVFPCRRSGRGPIIGVYDASAYAYTVRRAAARVGLAGLHPYAARHAARMRFSRLGGLEMARAAMGHTTADTTAEYGQAQDLELATRAALKAG